MIRRCEGCNKVLSDRGRPSLSGLCTSCGLTKIEQYNKKLKADAHDS